MRKQSTVCLLAVAFVALLAHHVSGEVALVRAQECSQTTGQCIIGYGTAFPVHKLPNGQSMWLTAGHVVRRAVRVHISLHGRWYSASVLYRPADRGPDLGILTATVPKLRTVYCLSPIIKRGQLVACNGFTYGKPKLHSWDATILLTPEENGGYARISTPFREGESGGPVFRDGKVVGLITHRDAQSGLGEFLPASTIARIVRERTRVVIACQPVVPVPVPVPAPVPVPTPVPAPPKATQPPPALKVDLSGVEKAIASIQGAIQKNGKRLDELERKLASVPQPKPPDLSPILSEIGTLKNRIESLPKPPPADLQPIQEEIRKTRGSLDAKIEKVASGVATISPLVWWALGLGGTAATGGTAALAFALIRTLVAARRRRKRKASRQQTRAGSQTGQQPQQPQASEPRVQADPQQTVTEQVTVGRVPKDCPFLENSASTSSNFKEEPQQAGVQEKVKPVVVSTQTPPPPQAIIPETRFVSVERDTFAEAYDWAKSDFVRSYPGAATTFQTLDNKIQQYLAAKGLKKGDT